MSGEGRGSPSPSPLQENLPDPQTRPESEGRFLEGSQRPAGVGVPVPHRAQGRNSTGVGPLNTGQRASPPLSRGLFCSLTGVSIFCTLRVWGCLAFLLVLGGWEDKPRWHPRRQTKEQCVPGCGALGSPGVAAQSRADGLSGSPRPPRFLFSPGRAWPSKGLPGTAPLPHTAPHFLLGRGVGEAWVAI